MKVDFQNRWLRVLIEILPAWPAIRRYRVVPPVFEGSTRRLIHRRIAWHLWQSSWEGNS